MDDGPGGTRDDEHRLTDAALTVDAPHAASGHAPPARATSAGAERYRILGEHGRGGIGRVLRAQDNLMGRVVAIKELLRRDRTNEARFFREAFLTARLEHPGIVPVHEAGERADGTPYYSMKLVAGRPLRELIEDAVTLEQRIALVPHVIAVADAVAYAHAQHVLHRDLKPGNVIVGDFGETVVIDWGLAKELAAPDDPPTPGHATGPDLTALGAVVGTPAYMAPEQARGLGGDERADVYALGAILYAVLAGHSPYHHDDSPDLVRVVASTPPPSLTALIPDAPPDLVAIAQAAMARETSQRLPSARAFADELRRYQRGQLVRSRRYSPAERALRWMRRHRELTAALVVAAIVIATIGGIAVARVVTERNLAERHRHRAEAALADADAQRDQLILTHARAAVVSDPTEALLWLRAYRGPDTDTAQELASRAAAGPAASFARHLQGTGILAAGASRFDPAQVFALGSDGVLRSWRAGAPAPAIVAIDTAAGVELRHSASTGELAFAASGRLHRVDAGGRIEIGDPVPRSLIALAFSPDGTWVYTASRSGAISLHARTRATIRLQLPPSASPISDVAVAADAAAVVACDLSRRLWSWTAARGWRVSSRCAAMPDDQYAFAPTGTLLAVASAQDVRLIDVDGGRERALPRAAAATSLLRFASPDALLIADQEGGLDEVNVHTLEQRHLLSAGVASFTMTALGDVVVVGFTDGTLMRVSRASGQSERIAGFNSMILSLQLSPDGRLLLAADTHDIRVLPMPSGRVWRTDQSASRGGVYSPDGRWLAVGGQLGDVLVVDRARPERLAHLRGHVDVVAALAVVGEQLVTGSWDGTLRAWRLVPDLWPSAVVLDAGRGILRVASLDRGNRALVLDTAGQLSDVRFTGGGPIARFRSKHAPWALSLSPDEQHAALLARDGTLEVVDLATGLVRTELPHPGAGQLASYDGRGLVLATIGSDGWLAFHERRGAPVAAVRLGARCSTLRAARVRIAIVCDGDTLIIAAPGTPPAWWPRRRFPSDLTALELSRDKRRLAIGTATGVLYTLDLATDALATRRVGAGRVTALAFAPDDEEIAVMTFSSFLHTVETRSLEAVPAGAALAPWLAARVDADAIPLSVSRRSP